MFGSLPSTASNGSSMDIEGNQMHLPTDDAEFEANWAIMNEVLRELELEPFQDIPEDQLEYVPSIEEFNQTQCPMCSNDTLYQFSANQPIICRQCTFQCQLKTGSLNEIHAYHRQTMGNCQETKLYSTLWHHEDGTMPSLLFVCTKCDFNFCL